MNLHFTLKAFDKAGESSILPNCFKKELHSQRSAIGGLCAKNTFSKDRNKAIVVYENVRKFLISKKAEFETQYNFKACSEVFSILVTMKNPNFKKGA